MIPNDTGVSYWRSFTCKEFWSEKFKSRAKESLVYDPLEPYCESIHKFVWRILRLELEKIVHWKALVLSKANQYSKSSLRDQFKNKLIY